jgi:hypothetical protein
VASAKGRRKAKFRVGQVVGFKCLPVSRIGHVMDIIPALGGGWGYMIEVPNAGRSGWGERDLRRLTKRERGQS